MLKFESFFFNLLFLCNSFQAKYKARRDELDGESECTLFVGRLNPETDEKSLLKVAYLIVIEYIIDILSNVDMSGGSDPTFFFFFPFFLSFFSFLLAFYFV